ncbi:kinetochore-associated protein DSN1 homolog [Gouania willdenowi]|uniref:kinetochore-associated protein DSN1 homolog n=1 Tax=Gouania willdenowi TaxID=441366 RepID=UPI001054EE9F|nr:uncharacterized protein LOC114468203 [Gouania willdenowi]
MAEQHLENGRGKCERVVVDEAQSEGNSSSKRCSSSSPTCTIASKSPRMDDFPSSTTQTSEEGSQLETNAQVVHVEDPVDSTSTRRKSWKRATLTRRSFPIIPNPYQVLSRSIATSLSQQERLEKLMEASMKLALERTESCLASVPNTSVESFKKQVEQIQKEWCDLGTKISREIPQLPSNEASSRVPVVQGFMKKVKKSIDRLQAESENWQALLNKHRSKAEELKRKVEQGKDLGVPLDPTLMAQSSQYHVIQNKPDYHLVFCRQQPVLQTMEMTMDLQSRMVRKLLSIKEYSQSLLKETSSQLAAEAGFQDISLDTLKNLMIAPLPSTTT